MSTKHDDQLALAHLALVDMERVQKSIEYLKGSDDEYLRAALFRDAVISYAKPFLNNRFSDGRRGLRISENLVPQSLAQVHKEVISLRDQLIAHTDMTVQRPSIERGQDELGFNFSMTSSGYSKLHVEHLIDPVFQLAKDIHADLLNGRSDQATVVL